MVSTRKKKRTIKVTGIGKTVLHQEGTLGINRRSLLKQFEQISDEDKGWQTPGTGKTMAYFERNERTGRATVCRSDGKQEKGQRHVFSEESIKKTSSDGEPRCQSK